MKRVEEGYDRRIVSTEQIQKELRAVVRKEGLLLRNEHRGLKCKVDSQTVVSHIPVHVRKTVGYGGEKEQRVLYRENKSTE